MSSDQVEETTNLSPHFRATQTAVEADLVIALYKAYTQCRRDEILRCSLHALHDVLAVDDRLNMLRNRRVGACPTVLLVVFAPYNLRTGLTDAVLVHERDQIGLSEQARSRCLTLLELAYTGHELFVFREIWELLVRPFVVWENIEIIAFAHGQTWQNVRRDVQKK